MSTPEIRLHVPTSYADLLKLHEDDRWEIISGVPYNMTPAPTPRHQTIALNLSLEFGNYLRGKSCNIYPAPFDVRLFAEGKQAKEITTVIQPDLSIICDPSKIDDRGCVGAPDLVVEISSPSTWKRDKNEKLRLYLKAGVREYWIVNLELEVVEVYRFQTEPGLFPEIAMYTLKDNDQIKVGIFDDLELSLQSIFS
ncbi:Uma2 family endonuclease [Tumebacillus permanentifrigoris]|uniref:Uma2 family endonuclease n=1 Tax=Tumebacillus permanentifrigoris TaxID=378543 RepID=A0A316D7P2_9BACL|nr:Uma2 family endonuclease [Tumebacillus permanentifrigoris]PWK11588.1 Uma2 family endonuclease [Tumebacillus permanentifrigoris]